MPTTLLETPEPSAGTDGLQVGMQIRASVLCVEITICLRRTPILQSRAIVGPTPDLRTLLVPVCGQVDGRTVLEPQNLLVMLLTEDINKQTKQTKQTKQASKQTKKQNKQDQTNIKKYISLIQRKIQPPKT